jgi:hypothetical protein
MGNSLRRRYATAAERAVPYILSAAILAAPLLSLNCRKNGEKRAVAVEQKAAYSVENEAKEVRNSLVLFSWFGANIKGDRPAILREEERIGRLVKDFGPEEMLRLYKQVEKDLKGFDSGRRSEKKAGVIEMCSASLTYAKETSGGVSVEARLGSLLFALPFLPDIMTDKTDTVLSGRGYYWAIGSGYINLLGRGKEGFESVSREVKDWATGGQPLSDDSLRFLFATMTDARDYQQKAK